jgi:hypothetical protein
LQGQFEKAKDEKGPTNPNHGFYKAILYCSVETIESQFKKREIKVVAVLAICRVRVWFPLWKSGRVKPSGWAFALALAKAERDTLGKIVLITSGLKGVAQGPFEKDLVQPSSMRASASPATSVASARFTLFVSNALCGGVLVAAVGFTVVALIAEDSGWFCLARPWVMVWKGSSLFAAGPLWSAL